jgi:hypothetical protein
LGGFEITARKFDVNTWYRKMNIFDLPKLTLMEELMTVLAESSNFRVV